MLAQTTHAQPEETTAVTWISTLLPLGLIVVLTILFFRYLKRFIDLQKRSRDHMAAMEQKTDKMVELLARIESKLKP